MEAFVAGGATVNISGTTSTANVALTAGIAGKQVRVYNAAAVAAFITFGDSTITATLAAGTPVAPGAVEVFGLPGLITYAAAILPSSTGSVYFTVGSGI